VPARMLEEGQELTVEGAGATCRVGALLGGGSQGEVYEAELDGSAVALKWYFPTWASVGQRRALEGLIARPSPSPAFLWPLALATVPGQASYGYLMPLLESRFRPMSDLMRREVESSFRSLATTGFHLAHNFLALHSQGLCYRDISFGNVALDPDTGDVMIADNDNVAVDGAGLAGLLGTPRFMAPEVVRGESSPGTQTDLWSLAVLLFYLFVMHHPLEGAQELAGAPLDLSAMASLYGKNAVFIFDPEDESNRPLVDEHGNAIAFWPLYPDFVRSMFTRAFTTGLRDPLGGRVREGEWRQAMIALRNLIVYCAQCGAESFADPGGGPAFSVPTAPKPATADCWSCGHALTLPLHMTVGRSMVMLNHDTRLYAHHTDPTRRFDFEEVTAEVCPNPADPAVLGLRNLSKRPWRCLAASGSAYHVSPGHAFRLSPGSTIDFGATRGRIGATAPVGTV
jgi:hypothetical protein